MPLGPLPAWNILQHASTLLGVITLLGLALRSLRTFAILAVVALAALVVTAFAWHPVQLKSWIVLNANIFIVLSTLSLTLAGLRMKKMRRSAKRVG